MCQNIANLFQLFVKIYMVCNMVSSKVMHYNLVSVLSMNGSIDRRGMDVCIDKSIITASSIFSVDKKTEYAASHMVFAVIMY